MSAGKGDKRRPMQISSEKFEENWKRIFGKTKPKPKKAKSENGKAKNKDSK